MATLNVVQAGSPHQTANVRVDEATRRLVIEIPAQQAPKTAPKTSILDTLYNHKGKIAFAASALILGSHIPGATAFVANNYQTVWNPLVTTGAKVASFVGNYLPEINVGLSCLWAAPNAVKNLKQKNYTTALAYTAAGIASAATPFCLKPDFTFAGAWAKTTALATGTFSYMKSFFHDEL